MSIPYPTLKPGGAAQLDSFLKRVVEKRDVPGVFLAATNARETIYEAQLGDLEFGHPEKGQIDRDTSEFYN